MKLKKLGAIFLSLWMILALFPVTAMASGDAITGPDGEKKVIENDLIVQLPSSLDQLIGSGPSGWLAVMSDPSWNDGTILDVVDATQEFYDIDGNKLSDEDTFKNNSRYTVKTTFKSYDSYYGDYYCVLSGTRLFSYRRNSISSIKPCILPTKE